jgi:hypothetical protein
MADSQYDLVAEISAAFLRIIMSCFIAARAIGTTAA